MTWQQSPVDGGEHWVLPRGTAGDAAGRVDLYRGDVRAMLKLVPDNSVHTVCTSPPFFGLRNYGVGAENGEMGSEPTPAAFIEALVEVFREVKRVLHPSGTLFLNLGDSYWGSGKGPTGSTGIGDQASRQGFVGGRSRGARSYGTNGTARSGYPGGDSSLSSLCDECLAAYLSRTSHNDTQPSPESNACGDAPSQDRSRWSDPSLDNADSSQPSRSVRSGRAKLDPSRKPAPAGEPLLVSLESTSQQSAEQPRVACSRCASRRDALSQSLQHSSTLGVQPSADTKACTNGTSQKSFSSADRSRDTDRSGDDASHSWGDYTTAYHQPFKPKDLMGMPWRLAFALQDDGWWLRSAITWCKAAPMPESIRDRPTSATEMIFLLSKRERYFYDQEAVRQPNSTGTIERWGEEHARLRPGNGIPNWEPMRGEQVLGVSSAGRNLWNYWVLPPENTAEAHFATFPSEIPRRAILAGTSEHGVCSAPGCGAPWARTISRPSGGQIGASWNDQKNAAERGNAKSMGGSAWRTYQPGTPLGWQPTCTHSAEVIPATVLDPFLGSGTTAKVASRLGRSSIGIELNPEYAAMSRRLIAETPLFTGGDYSAPDAPEPDKQAQVRKRTYSGFNARWDAKEASERATPLALFGPETAR